MPKLKINKIASKNRADLPRKNMLVAGALVAAVLILLGGLINNQQKSDNSKKPTGPVAFKVNDDELRESELKELIKYPTEKADLSEEEAVNLAFQSYKYIIVAKDLGINPTKDEVNSIKSGLVSDEIKNLADYTNIYDKWFTLLAKEQAARQYVGDQGAPNYKGYSLVFPFGQHIEYLEDDKPEGLNDQSLIQKDKDYAKERAEYYHAQVKDKKMKPEQVDKEIQNDAKLSDLASTINPFGYDSKMLWQDEVFYESSINYIKSLKKKGLSDIKTIEAYPSGVAKDGEKKLEIAYYFVVLDESPESESVSQQDFDASFKNAKAENLYKPTQNSENAENPLNQQGTNNAN